MADTNENKDTVLEDASTSSSERELLKLQMAFDYYKQQREEMAILGKERSSLTKLV